MNDSRYAVGRSVGPLLGLAAAMLLAVAGAKAAVIGGDRVFAKPILDPLVRAFLEDRHPDEPLRVVCRGEWEMAEAFGRGQSEAMLTIGPLSQAMRSVVAQHAPGGNLVRWEQVEIGQVRVIASGWYRFRDNFALCADAREVIDEIAADRNGIGFVVFTGQLPKGVRVLPLSEKPGGDFVTPKLTPVAQKEYALSLPILLHLHPAASQTTRDFARWAGSRAAAR